MWDYFLMTVGSLIFCMAWTSFVIPNGLASGGLTGLCTIIQYATGGAVPIGWTYPIVNIGLLLLGFLTLGKGFGIKTIYVIALTSVLFEVLPMFPGLHVMMEEKQKNKAILLISTELSEIFEMCDRIAIMYKGEVMGIYRNGELTTEEIGLLMAGVRSEKEVTE